LAGKKIKTLIAGPIGQQLRLIQPNMQPSHLDQTANDNFTD
jgi:hypothetical protein